MLNLCCNDITKSIAYAYDFNLTYIKNGFVGIY
jgi:hypothetical protein